MRTSILNKGNSTTRTSTAVPVVYQREVLEVPFKVFSNRINVEEVTAVLRLKGSEVPVFRKKYRTIRFLYLQLAEGSIANAQEGLWKVV